MSTISLIKSAFGITSTLYTVLNCTESSSQAELRSAYRKAALRYHPDRRGINSAQQTNNDDEHTNLRFQAVSAAYQVLMDEKRRAEYDATGRVLEEHDDDTFGSFSDDEREQQVPSERRRQTTKKSRSQKQQQWEDFFHSIFNEILSAGYKHEEDAKLYTGSVQERDDVLKYYSMCKGDMQKVLECIVHASNDDIDRWRKDIIGPAIHSGEVDDFSVTNVTKRLAKSENSTKKQTFVDSSSSDDDAVSSSKRSNKLKRLIRGKCSSKCISALIDTDEEDDSFNYAATKQFEWSNSQNTPSTGMSMREKMDYRVAKKRKIKAEKEMEIARIVQSKNWNANHHFYSKQQHKNRNSGCVSDMLLSKIEKKNGSKRNAKRLRKT